MVANQLLTRCKLFTTSHNHQKTIAMINYLSKFTLRLSELAECLCGMIYINVPSQFGPEHTEVFKSIKQEIMQHPVYNMTPSNSLCCKQIYTSVKELGTCLLHCEHSVYFGSKALTDSQRGYVAIEPTPNFGQEIPFVP